ncbi:hypothetical protein BJY01DRAFT_223430 [Aspergillus pseudoustus]|uniref:BZIP domain-containing protein n=1 Tax=Aspergillus pseudoustus TaxID=1810923 RepID=A0ABR4J6A5_9EURO
MDRRALTGNQKTANAARIRDNQRRSRTRRKEYVRELEERVRNYEKLGITATEEVQAAGRKVARENEWLRDLLGLHGILASEVNQYLASRRNGKAGPALLESSKQRGYIESTTTLSTKNHPDQDVLRTHSTPASRVQLPVAFSDEESILEDRPASDEANARPINQYTTAEQHDETSMSCEAAVDMIVGMHSDQDRSVIRERLGCRSTNCQVRHLTIFEMLDFQ